MDASDDLQHHLSAAQTEALQVGDSPSRADQLAAKLPAIVRSVDRSGLSSDVQARMRDALARAERVLRRDDDGREAARHLQAAMSLLAPRPRKASPFLDDDEEQ